MQSTYVIPFVTQAIMILLDVLAALSLVAKLELQILSLSLKLLLKIFKLSRLFPLIFLMLI